MLVAGELKNFTIYFGQFQNTGYCSFEVVHTTGRDLSYQARKPGRKDSKNTLYLKLVVTEETYKLLFQKTCYFELKDQVERPLDNPTYRVIGILKKDEFFEKYNKGANFMNFCG